MSLVQELPFKHLVSRFKWNIGVAAVLATAAVSPLLPMSVTGVQAASQSFSATGADQSFTVPNGVTEIQVYVRGAGGGSPVTQLLAKVLMFAPSWQSLPVKC